MSREEFFLWAESQDGRYEFDGSQPVAMTGGTNGHGIICGNTYFALRRRLAGGPCRPMAAESGGVATAGNKVRYPDAAVTCSPVAAAERLIPEPVVLFEVVSPSSVHEDHVDKRVEYQALPSVQRYVVVEQSRKQLTVHARGAAGAWREDTLDGSAVLEMPEIGVTLPIAELYEDVPLPG